MTRPKNDIERLRTLIDAVEESILNASDEEILEDICLEGRDPDQVARSVQNMIGAKIKAHRQQKLKAAREGYARVSQNRRSPLATLKDPVARRALLERIIATRDDLPAGITMAFRQGGEMSDEDVASLLEDLSQLGIPLEGEDP